MNQLWNCKLSLSFRSTDDCEMVTYRDGRRFRPPHNPIGCQRLLVAVNFFSIRRDGDAFRLLCVTRVCDDQSFWHWFIHLERAEHLRQRHSIKSSLSVRKLNWHLFLQMQIKYANECFLASNNHVLCRFVVQKLKDDQLEMKFHAKWNILAVCSRQGGSGRSLKYSFRMNLGRNSNGNEILTG